MDKLIQNFSVKSVTDFFKTKISSFSPNSENLDYVLKQADFEDFSDLKKIGEVEFSNSDELIVFTCKFQGVLSERSSKKRQFEIAKKVLKEDFKDGAIFIFYDDNDCFRFSFIRKNYGNKEQKFTNWKRYTYFVEPSRTNKTFKNRINGCNFSSLEDIQEAFSVEKLNRKFYEEIATAFYSLIGGKVSINKKEVSFNSCLQLPSTPTENRKVYQEFAVRLIGRTIFCWFLKNKKSDSGIPLIPEEWLSSKMVESVNNDEHNYYHSIIEKLFFLVLNKKHEDRKPYVLPNNHEFVPFLNGGLFEAQDDDFFPKDNKGIHIQNFGLNIPNQWFKDFFETLEQYNFTIDENSINDFEVSIDPEMLGTIFENLLAEIDPDTEKSARKSTGSFYTPREIVDYMVEQSLLQYIKTKTNIEDEEQLEVLLNDDAENPFNEKETIVILEALSDVKILDPACGSGAFPMGVLHKIISLLKKLDKGAVWWKAKQLEKIDNALVRKAMETKLNQANSDYIRKLGVIQHSIYGVDIQPIAAEISKLRSFLSLIIDENIDDKAENRGIEPLPNLEFKFVTANTLISLEKGNTIGKDMTLDFGETSDLQNQLQQLRNSYLQATPQEKDKLKKQFENLQTKIYKQEVLNAGGIGSIRAQQLVTWKPFSNEGSTWFDPDWMFGVEKFDVVIGNPPYIDSETMVKSGKQDFRDYLVKRFKYCKGNWDIYIPFFELSYELLSKNGVLTFITPDKWTSKPFGKVLRENLFFNMSKIVIAGRDVFETAKVDAIITFFTNKKNKNIESYSFSKKNHSLEKVNSFETDKLTNDFVFDMFFSDNVSFIDKLMDNDKISNLGICENACSTADTYILDNIIQNIEKYNKDYYKIINTGTINKYVSKWGLKEMKYLGNKYLQPVASKKAFQNTFQNTYFEKTNKPKLIIKGLTLLDLCIDTDGIFIPGKSTLIITSKEPNNLKFLLGLLNCKLFIFILKEKYSSSSYNGGVTFTKDMINNLPLSKNYKNVYDEIVRLVDKILINIENNEDITDIETKITIMVYKLYELTFDEVLVVETGFGLSKQEYDNFKI